MNNICELPGDLLAEIFGYIPEGQLPSLTTVCRRFNAVVENYLMDRFPEVEWVKENFKQPDMIHALVTSKRKYKRFWIFEVDGISQELREMITRLAAYLSVIRFSFSSLKITEFASVMQTVSDSLREIRLHQIEFEADNKTAIEPITFKRLKSINMEFNGGSGLNSVFNIFQNATTVEEFEIYVNETDEYAEFIQSLDGLKRLQIGFGAVENFNNDLINSCKFRLDSLAVIARGEVIAGETEVHFYHFLDEQRSSLKDLKLSDFSTTVDQLEFMLKLNVEVLKLDDCIYAIDREIQVQNSSVRSLELSRSKSMNEENTAVVTSELVRKCINLKCIRFEFFDVSSLNVAFALRQSNIESIMLNRSTLRYPLPIPSLKTLKIKWVENDHRDGAVHLILLNSQLKKLSVPASLQDHPLFAQAIANLNLEKFEQT